MVLIADWTQSTYEPDKVLEIDKIFKSAIKLGCSDIHLQVDRPPIFRIRGALKPLQMDPISESGMIELTFPMMDQRNLDIFHRDGGADFAKTLI
ncbi:MAG: twitching motility protein PilT, partial [Planctomyces sp.]|nr:twitching motility protein PilT [Planctomyces sp.]